MKRIVFVCQVFFPDATSTSQLFTALFEEMAGKDAEIQILCGFPTSQSHQAGRRLPRREVYRGIRIRRVGLRVDLKKNLLARAAAYLSFLVQTGWHMLWMKKPDVLFGVTNPPILAPMLWVISKIRRMPYQYMILDQYPESLIALGSMKRSAFLTRSWIWANRIAYQRAEKMIVLGRDMITLLQEDYGIEESRIVYIPHWSAVELQAPMPVEESRMVDELGLREKFIVQYSGNMGMWHDMASLVRAAKMCEDEPGIHFLFVGNGARREAAIKLSEELATTNITWHDFVPLEQLRESLSSCHVALISLRAGFEGIAVPSKLYGILASGRAIIAQVPDGTEVALTLEEDGCGLWVDPGDIQGVAAAVRELAADRERTDEYGRRAFESFRTKYRLEHALSAFRELWNLRPEAKADEPVEAEAVMNAGERT